MLNFSPAVWLPSRFLVLVRPHLMGLCEPSIPAFLLFMRVKPNEGRNEGIIYGNLND